MNLIRLMQNCKQLNYTISLILRSYRLLYRFNFSNKLSVQEKRTLIYLQNFHDSTKQ